jgi:SOS-response transcriptional repressor LexA
MDQNEEIFVRFMNDIPFQKVVTTWMASEAYKRLRSDAGRESPSVELGTGVSETRPKLQIVQPRPKDRYVTCVPLVPLKAAAGAFSDSQHVEDEARTWVAVETKHHLRPGMFVTQVVGKSMEPAIQDGAYCLFAAPVTGTRQGKTVLVQLRDAIDPESGQRYTVKRYESEKTKDGNSWRHVVITLKPVNPNFQPIVVTGADDGQLRVIAELVEVLGDKMEIEE